VPPAPVKRIHAVDAILAALSGKSRDALGRATDATDCAQDPDFVACPDAPVSPTIAHERQRIRCCSDGSGCMRRESILVHTGEQRREVVCMNVGAACDLRRSAADDLAVLADRLAGLQRPQCELVAARNGIGQLDRDALQLEVLAGRQVAQRDRHVVARADAIAGRQGGGSAVHGR
jgi:hypothetical protein